MLNTWWKLLFLILFLPFWSVAFLIRFVLRFMILGWDLADQIFDFYFIKTQESEG